MQPWLLVFVSTEQGMPSEAFPPMIFYEKEDVEQRKGSLQELTPTGGLDHSLELNLVAELKRKQ